MLLINCPHCGARPESEFRCAGESHKVRPGPHTQVSEVEWYRYLFERTNPKGVNFERWCHVHGCGRWFNVARDTLTHTIHAVYPMDGARPQIEAGEA